MVDHGKATVSDSSVGIKNTEGGVFVYPSIRGRNSNVERKPIPGQLRDGESHKAHPRCLLLFVFIFISMRFVVLCLFVLNLCCKIPSFLPPGERAQVQVLCSLWTWSPD